MRDISLQEASRYFDLILFDTRQDLTLISGEAREDKREHVWLRVRRTDEREFSIRVNRRTGLIEPLPGGGESAGEPPNWRWGHRLGTRDEYEERHRHPRYKPAFRCRACGRLEHAGHAGENAVPRSCSVCGRADPSNWEVLADVTPDRLNELGLTPEEVDRHVPPCATEPNRPPKTVSVLATDSVKSSEHMAVQQEQPGRGVINYSETDRERLAGGSSFRDDGGIDMSLVGAPPQGEQDNRKVGQVLVERLTLDSFDGVLWESVEPSHEQHDCEFADRNDPKRRRRLGVQVVRAMVSEDLLRELASSGSVQKRFSPVEAAGLLRAAIEKKARDASQSLGLALDATRLPGLAFDEVVREFRSTHLTWAASQGFKAIWLVGPTIRLTWRLDL